MLLLCHFRLLLHQVDEKPVDWKQRKYRRVCHAKQPFPRTFLVEHFQNPSSHPQPSRLLLVAKVSPHTFHQKERGWRHAKPLACPGAGYRGDTMSGLYVPLWRGNCALCLACLHPPHLFAPLQCGYPCTQPQTSRC